MAKYNSITYIYSFKIAQCFIGVLLFTSFSCNTSNTTEPNSRSFKMGFTTWSFGPNLQDVNDTYTFIENTADIYAEHIDSKIPWNAWINNLDLPQTFTNEIEGRANRKINTHDLVLSVSLLNSNRDELAEDFDGSIPNYTNLNDNHIEDAYVKHINYLVNAFSPDYLVIAIEVNELRLRAPEKWLGYKQLMANVTSRIKEEHSDLKISESISLHNLYEPNTTDTSAYINDILSHINTLDFIAISYYPFLNNQSTESDFQDTFNFLHNNVNSPVAFVETSHLAENLVVPNLNVSINGSESDQNLYLETLLNNAQNQNYEFTIWWTHKDYDALWETFPPELLDLGQLWRDTGLISENGTERLSLSTWERVLEN
ncbi:glycosyl hydrolase 53 family protein [Ichthyenterobacterium sp. W332]|uniref:Arabinogalactan endo-beta-1,4-galactanase n=1 Tax=Microcosmobacter mediterraneus TaxID=3075607 RepID=A0ABU2YIH3_9FLAO|nr:glycosyl hydrolase 53 family protein [Ichthyenterobacterium sp. W332]MDT0557974.1 glycosyl hydrolase 53 family protein [Ichthyenterobacterium sp. W332]